MAGAFEVYLRTRQVRVEGKLEVKFNPWHDPAVGRFTFRNSGTRFGTGSESNFARRPGRTDPRVMRLGNARRAALDPVDPAKFQPDNPRNHGIHIVRKGESIGSIAHTRKGLRPRDLAELNSIREPNRLRVGQQIKLPHQAYLDAGKRARDKFMGLAYYLDTHGGRLPPNAANPPSIADQIAADHHGVERNGHVFTVDPLARTHRVAMRIGPINPQSEILARRSRSAQSNAGKPNREHSDDGGHYVAPRFGGTHEAFNHFAQDANLNRGPYRVLEDKWDAYRKAGKSVRITITPRYDGLSKRPKSLDIYYVVDGMENQKSFRNRKGGL